MKMLIWCYHQYHHVGTLTRANNNLGHQEVLIPVGEWRDRKNHHAVGQILILKGYLLCRGMFAKRVAIFLLRCEFLRVTIYVRDISSQLEQRLTLTSFFRFSINYRIALNNTISFFNF